MVKNNEGVDYRADEKASAALVTVLLVLGSQTAASAAGAERECRGHTGFYLTSGYANIPTTWDKSKNRNCWLARKGSYSAPAKTLQYHLYHAEEHYDLDIDGYYGPLTESAVRAVQDSYGLVADGEYGPLTGENMLWYGGYWRYGHWK